MAGDDRDLPRSDRVKAPTARLRRTIDQRARRGKRSAAELLDEERGSR